MATGEKIFLADKQTLDMVNTKIGDTTNGGGSATAGTLMGKLNAVITSIASHVANWTAARAANLDAAVSTRQSESNAASRYNTLNSNTAVNNTASATGTLSQKLSYIIGQFAGVAQKKLASKVVNFTVESPGTYTILNVTGGGRFEFAYTSMGYTNSVVTIEIDGQKQVFDKDTGSKYIFGSIYNAGLLLYAISSSAISATHFAASKPVFFKNSLKITVTTNVATEFFFRGNYAVYE